MEVETAYAGYLYRSGESPVDIDTKVPYKIKFTLEDLTENYIMTPLDQLFKFAMEKLGIPFLHAEAVLPRRYQNYFIPFELEFIASNGENSQVVAYSRTLTERPVFFDGLENGKIKLDALINEIRTCEPVGGRVNIKVNDLNLALKSGFDYGKYSVNNLLSYGDGYCYKNSVQKLTVELNIPWLNKHLHGSRIEHDLERKSLDEAVQIAENILVDYLETLK